MKTLSSALAWWARMQGETVALTVAGEPVTYADYHDWSNRLAVWLHGLGVRPGDRVGVCAANSLSYCLLIMGIMRAGAIVAPMNARFTRPEIAEIVQDLSPSLLVADADHRPLVEGLGPAVEDMAAVAGFRGGPRAELGLDLDPAWPVVIISTSGSTARPKGVMFTHESMVSYATEFHLQEPGVSKGARVLALAPLSTSAGFVQLIHYTTLGCTLYMEPAFEPKSGLALLQREKINAFGGVPLLFERIAALDEFAAADLSQLRFVTVGGARVTRALLDAWMAKGVVIRQIYGQTECGGNATIMPEALAREAPEKCGWGGPFTEIVTVRPDGSRCDPGETGEILIRGPGRMIGYWNNPQATAEAIRDGWLRTGDLGVLDERGLLTFVDRMKDIIISGGLNISAAEVERAVGGFPGVEEVVVIAAPDPKFAETPMAVLYATRDIDVAGLIAHCNACLADYKVPRYVVVESQPLPRLATGKLSKPAVRAKYKDQIADLPRVR
ncbi:MAG TPA: AMP-binding protein [Phenylobacterium sp.]|nr:AMP-binding protein [Phenylobacterium sp.]